MRGRDILEIDLFTLLECLNIFGNAGAAPPSSNFRKRGVGGGGGFEDAEDEGDGRSGRRLDERGGSGSTSGSGFGSSKWRKSAGGGFGGDSAGGKATAMRMTYEAAGCPLVLV